MQPKKPPTEGHGRFQPRRRIAILAIPPVNELDVVGPFQVFATANRYAKRPVEPYRVEVVTTGRGPRIAGNGGLSLLAHRPYQRLGNPVDTLLVAGGVGARSCRAPGVLEWLTRMAPRVRRLGSVCTGAFMLAEAGLLDGCRVTTHWAFAADLAARFPRVVVDPGPIWRREGNLYTSAGVTAGMDLSLALVEEDLGGELALAVARDLVLFLRRPGTQAQFSRLLDAQGAARKPLQELLVWVLENLDKGLSVDQLAARAAMSRRNFSRVFAEELGTGPAHYVEQLRVEAARHLLEQTNQSVEAIASSCGFSSAELMRRAFLRALGISPSQYRERFCSAPSGPGNALGEVPSFGPNAAATA
ncbi:MAG: GlxA family transcriptional regulator [Verrucomicrobia bacterium]|nr:GlxA family transcriptional regulator [Verrucomicrobiota bacterium]